MHFNYQKSINNKLTFDIEVIAVLFKKLIGNIEGENEKDIVFNGFVLSSKGKKLL